MSVAIQSSTAPQPKPAPATVDRKEPSHTDAAAKTSQRATVTISSAGRQALIEATETPQQTAKEARSGDRQAQRLLAKQAAAKAVR